MCFSIEVDVNIRRLSNQFKAQISNRFEHPIISKKALGPVKNDSIPAICAKDGELVVENFDWSLTPSWSEYYPTKWSTYNARMERNNNDKNQKIFDVPTFKNAFRKNQFCLIPIKGSIEACYWGETAGKILSFKRKDNENYFAVGLWDQWQDKKTKKVEYSATLITDSPYEYFFKHGHDRSIIVYPEGDFEDLLLNTSRGYDESFKHIRTKRINQEWQYEIEREMKKGWEKKIPTKKEIEEIGQGIWK